MSPEGGTRIARTHRRSGDPFTWGRSRRSATASTASSSSGAAIATTVFARNRIASTSSARARAAGSSIDPTIATSRVGPRERSSADSACPKPDGALPSTSRIRRIRRHTDPLELLVSGQERDPLDARRPPPSSRRHGVVVELLRPDHEGVDVRARLEEPPTLVVREQPDEIVDQPLRLAEPPQLTRAWRTARSMADASSAWSSAYARPPGRAVSPGTKEPAVGTPQVRKHELGGGRSRRR